MGGGGHAKVLIEALKLAGVEIVGIVEKDASFKGGSLCGVPILGGEETLEYFPPGSVGLVNGVGSVKSPKVRKELYERFRFKGYSFFNVIHPFTAVASDVELADGVQIMAGSVLQPGCRVGSNTIINTRASLDHDCVIGDHAHVAPGVTLSGGVAVCEAAHLGTGAIVIQGVTIGSWSVVAAGSVVVHDVAEKVMVRGVPAKVVSL